jgi:SNF2-related domain
MTPEVRARLDSNRQSDWNVNDDHDLNLATTAAPEQGQLVQVRSRPWVVNDVKPSSLPSPAMVLPVVKQQNLLTLSSVEDDGLGEELQVVWEIEPGAKVIERVALPEPTDFDSPDKLDAFLDAVRWGAASTADHKNIQSPFRSGIEIEDYQLDPVVRAIQMPRVNLLIADDVGLGKTIEAGMVGLELIIRHRARKILVVCPSALQIQWRDQMRDKFGLDFRIVDSSLMRDLRRRRGIHVNPWSHFPRLITSIDFLKRERPLRLFRETLPAPGETIYPRKYDLLIVDEAHNCAPSGIGKYAADSLRTQALRELAPHFEHKLFLTATPHNGYRESFSALLELLDNQRFSRGTEPDRKQLEAVMVRRLKSDPSFAFNHLGIRRFPPRILEPIEVPYTDEERGIHAALLIAPPPSNPATRTISNAFASVRHYFALAVATRPSPVLSGMLALPFLRKRGAHLGSAGDIDRAGMGDAD